MDKILTFANSFYIVCPFRTFELTANNLVKKSVSLSPVPTLNQTVEQNNEKVCSSSNDSL